jgi:hypothetical protein
VLQRLIAALLGVLGIAAIGLGVASATVWRADDPLVATAAPGGDSRTLVTDPGVLELAGDPVTVTVRAEGSPVVLAVGRDTDVTAWVGADPYARVTGLSGWHTLATTAGEPPAAATPQASAEPAPSPSAGATAEETAVQAADPTGSDMWVLEAGGDGSATLDWPAQDGRWSLIAVSLGETAPTLDLSWPQTVTTPWLWPGVALGVLLLAVAAILLVRILRSRDDADAGWHPVTTGAFATVAAPAGSPAAAGSAPGAAGQPVPGPPGDAIPVGTVGVSPPTRRQIREAEAAAAAAAAERRRGRRTPTGSIPAVTGATPVVTGAVPVVTGATPTTDRPVAEPVPAGGPQRPAAPTPAAGTPAAPGGAAASADTAGDTSTAPRRGLAGRLPWRKSRAEQAEGAVPAPGTAEPSAPTTAVPSTSVAPAPASTSWSPTPGAPARPAPAPGAAPAAPLVAGSGAAASPPGAPATPTGGSTAPGASPSAPAARPASRPGADDDAASRAQRADAWRRMWGFPADAGGPAGVDGDAAREDDARGTEEDR